MLLAYPKEVTTAVLLAPLNVIVKAALTFYPKVLVKAALRAYLTV